MPNYPNLNLGGKRPVDTYRYLLEQSASVITNGLGDTVDLLNTTSSWANTASYALSASYEIIFEESSSHANAADTAISASYSTIARTVTFGYQTPLTTGSTIPITSSQAISASWSSQTISSSYVSGPIGIIDTLSSVIITASAGIAAGGYASYSPTLYNTQVGYGQNEGHSGYYSTQIGYAVGQYTTDNTNTTQIGACAGRLATNASNAVQVGYAAGENTTNAIDTVQIGNSAGRFATNATKSVHVGMFAGYNAKTSSRSTFIGSSADTSDSSLNVETSIAIGYNAKVSGPNMCVLGGTGSDAVKVAIGANAAINTLDVVGNISCSVITASLNAPNRITMGSTNTVGFFGVTPAGVQTLATAVGTTITASAPVTPDYDIQAVGVNWDSACWGVSSSDELLSCMNAIKNLQSRVTLLEASLNTLGLTTYN